MFGLWLSASSTTGSLSSGTWRTRKLICAMADCSCAPCAAKSFAFEAMVKTKLRPVCCECFLLIKLWYAYLSNVFRGCPRTARLVRSSPAHCRWGVSLQLLCQARRAAPPHGPRDGKVVEDQGLCPPCGFAGDGKSPKQDSALPTSHSGGQCLVLEMGEFKVRSSKFGFQISNFKSQISKL